MRKIPEDHYREVYAANHLAGKLSVLCKSYICFFVIEGIEI